MKRREFTDEEWNRILKLKQGGASWLRIEKEIGIPRRTMTRAYEEWESTKSIDELKQARIGVAAGEFQDHIDNLVTLAESMIKALYTPLLMEEIPKASELLDSLWKEDIRNDYGGAIPMEEVHRVVRRNQRLYRSLKEHTRGKVRWEVLEEWEQALDRYRRDGKELRMEAGRLVKDLVAERSGLGNRIKATGRKNEIAEEMVKGTVESLWRSVLAGEVDKCDEYIKTMPLGSRGWQVYFGKEGSRITIDLDDAELTEEVAEACRTAVRAIIQGGKSVVVDELAADMKVMEKKRQLLEDMLDRIVLRPTILRTRCELCPA